MNRFWFSGAGIWAMSLLISEEFMKPTRHLTRRVQFMNRWKLRVSVKNLILLINMRFLIPHGQ